MHDRHLLLVLVMVVSGCGATADGAGSSDAAVTSDSDATSDVATASDAADVVDVGLGRGGDGQVAPSEDAPASPQDGGTSVPGPAVGETLWHIHVESAQPLAHGEDISDGHVRVSARFPNAHPLLSEYVTTMEEGGCRVREQEWPFCDPPCAAGDICSPPGVCHPWPTYASAGAMHLTTSSGIDTEVTWNPYGSYWVSASNEPLPAGVQVTVNAAGDEVPAFEVSGVMPEPFSVDTSLSSWNLEIDVSQDLVFQWETVDPDARIHFFYAAESLHGLAYSAVLECDVVDTGEIRVSATLLERFCDGSLWHCGECPPLVVKRYRTSTVDVAGQPVTLWIESVLTTPASIFPSCP